MELIPARSGTATFLPAGKIIKIINTSGTQVIDTWAFALPKPERKKGDAPPEAEEEAVPKQPSSSSATPSNKTQRSKRTSDLPSQEDAEKATQAVLAQGEQSVEDHAKKGTSWTGYLPSVPNVPSSSFGKSKSNADAAASKASKDQQAKDSKTWSSYFAAGKVGHPMLDTFLWLTSFLGCQGFSSYIPQQATDTVTQFAGYVGLV